MEQKKSDLAEIIESEKLKPEPTLRLINGAFRDGTLKTIGTDIDRIMPPVSRFSEGGRATKKQTVIERLQEFFEKYLGLV